MSPANLLSAWCRLLVSTLVRAGITDVAVSPGSRSTPIVIALCREASLRIHVLIDERSAGFFALGQARATGKPSLCVCTSGSAVANYYPAVIEAAESGIPLVILSADRPFELLEAAAPQTIDQNKLFGSYARQYVELGMPDDHPSALVALQRRAAQAVARSRWPEPGAVHLNLRARKPLEPAPADGPAGAALERRVAELVDRGPPRIDVPETSVSEPAIARLGERLAASSRTLIACGPLPMTEPATAAIAELCRQSGAVLLPEAASQIRLAIPPILPQAQVCDGFDALLDTEAGRTILDPELIVEFGRPLVSGAWERYVAAHPDTERWRAASKPASDPAATAREILIGDAAPIAEALCRTLERRAPNIEIAESRRSWIERVHTANRVVWESVAEASSDRAVLDEAQAARAVLSSVKAGETLALGNSLPIRDADWFCRASGANVRVWTQRGTNGIDGLISGAIGAATTSSAPTTLLVGDISMLHDVGGLWAARELRTPFIAVVIHNGGGRIFEQLPLATRTDIPPEWIERWTTPHALELAHAARLYGIAHETVDSLDALTAAIGRARTRTGATLVIAEVEPSSALRVRRRVNERLIERLATLHSIAER